MENPGFAVADSVGTSTTGVPWGSIAKFGTSIIESLFGGGDDSPQYVWGSTVRTPPSNFDPEAYLAQNPDVARSADYASHPWDHFVEWGQGEGRKWAPDNWDQIKAQRDAELARKDAEALASQITRQAEIDAIVIKAQTDANQTVANAYLSAQQKAGATAGSGVNANSAATAAAQLMNTGAITPSVAPAPKKSDDDAMKNWTILGVVVAIVALILMMKGK